MTTLDVTSLGAKGLGTGDDTAAIQAAITMAKPGDTVHVPVGIYMINALQGNDNYAAGGVFLKSNLNMELASGAVLKAIPNASTHSTVVTVRACENVKITGPGSIVGDRDKHLDQTAGPGQWGFGLSIWGNSKNIVVTNLTIAKCWGDGLTVIDGSNLNISRVTFDKCRRQNMSIIAGDSIRITNCTFRNAQYSALDLEADLANQTISNVLIRDCSFFNSGGPAHIGVGSPVGTYRNITIKNCRFDRKMQPIFAHDKGGNTGTPWYAFLANRVLHQGLRMPSYRFWGYPTEWSCT